MNTDETLFYDVIQALANYRLLRSECGHGGTKHLTDLIERVNNHHALLHAEKVSRGAASPMPGAADFTMVVFSAEDVPAGTHVYTFTSS